MNAMWGAGQMMFNKILVLSSAYAKASADKPGFPLTDYLRLAQEVFKNMNPATDIYFSQGPMDVLDHSCSKLGFGGKMCIDGTLKTEEETDESYYFIHTDYEFDSSALTEKFSEIRSVNDKLIAKDIPCLIVSVEKNRVGHIRQLHQQVCESGLVEGIKLILYVEHTVNAKDLPVALWRFCNNLDPRRDSHLVQLTSKHQSSKTWACMGLDGTIKTKAHDNFQRDWPNIIVADDATIASVDKKWNELGINQFIPSPSLKYKDQLYGEEAVSSL
jgi:4-hydroxy-3-polyprenylbenzoate decarboxylase